MIKKLSLGVCCLLIIASCKMQQTPVTQKKSFLEQNPLVNTSWKISYVNDIYGKRTFDIVLIDDGKVACFNPFDTTPNNDEWEQHDGCIYIYFNNREAVYKAILFDDDLLVGDAHSRMGGSWNWMAEKYH